MLRHSSSFTRTRTTEYRYKMAEKLDTQSEEANSDEGGIISKPSSIVYCGPCLGDNEQNPAEGYCDDCSDYLCLTCYTVHRKVKQLKNHRLKTKSDMPVSKPNFADRFKNCTEHKYETIDYYCHSHGCALCKLCKSIDHRACSRIEALNIVCNDPEKVEEVKKMRDELKRLQTGFEENLNSARDNRADIEAYHQTAVKGIRVIRDKDLQMMSSIENACLAVSPQMTSLKNDFDSLMDDNCLSFLMMLANKSQVNTLSNRLDSMKMDNTISKYRFVPSFDNPENLGVITKCPSKLASITVETPTDCFNCCITGIARFSDTRLVVADYKNKKIKLVDLTKSYSNVVSEVKLDVTPWNLTKIDERRVAVTTADHQKILIITISEQITVTQTIDKSDFSHCYGIEYCNGELVVSFLGPFQIQIIDPDGTVKQNIEPKNEDDTELFASTKSCFIKKSFVQENLYLSIPTRNQLVSMTPTGNIQASFTHTSFKEPRGIALGTDGRVFVCCFKSNKVFEISSDLFEGHIIFDEKDDISKPYSILYDDIDQKLYIGSYNCDMIHVFLV